MTPSTRSRSRARSSSTTSNPLTNQPNQSTKQSRKDLSAESSQTSENHSSKLNSDHNGRPLHQMVIERLNKAQIVKRETADLLVPTATNQSISKPSNPPAKPNTKRSNKQTNQSDSQPNDRDAVTAEFHPQFSLAESLTNDSTSGADSLAATGASQSHKPVNSQSTELVNKQQATKQSIKQSSNSQSVDDNDANDLASEDQEYDEDVPIISLKPINQSNDQSNDQSVKRSDNQSNDQSTDRSIKQPNNESKDDSNQSKQDENQTVDHSNDQSIDQSNDQSVSQSNDQPNDQPINQPVKESSTQSMHQQIDQAIDQNTNQTVGDDDTHRSTQPDDQANIQSIIQSVINAQSANQSTNQSTNQSNTDSLDDVFDLPPSPPDQDEKYNDYDSPNNPAHDQSDDEVIDQSDDESTSHPINQSINQSINQPTDSPIDVSDDDDATIQPITPLTNDRTINQATSSRSIIQSTAQSNRRPIKAPPNNTSITAFFAQSRSSIDGIAEQYDAQSVTQSTTQSVNQPISQPTTSSTVLSTSHLAPASKHCIPPPIHSAATKEISREAESQHRELHDEAIIDLDQMIDQSNEQLANQPANQASNRPVNQPVAQSSNPAAEPADNSVTEPAANQPITQSNNQSAADNGSSNQSAHAPINRANNPAAAPQPINQPSRQSNDPPRDPASHSMNNQSINQSHNQSNTAAINRPNIAGGKPRQLATISLDIARARFSVLPENDPRELVVSFTARCQAGIRFIQGFHAIRLHQTNQRNHLSKALSSMLSLPFIPTDMIVNPDRAFKSLTKQATDIPNNSALKSWLDVITTADSITDPRLLTLNLCPAVNGFDVNKAGWFDILDSSTYVIKPHHSEKSETARIKFIFRNKHLLIVFAALLAQFEAAHNHPAITQLINQHSTLRPTKEFLGREQQAPAGYANLHTRLTQLKASVLGDGNQSADQFAHLTPQPAIIASLRTTPQPLVHRYATIRITGLSLSQSPNRFLFIPRSNQTIPQSEAEALTDMKRCIQWHADLQTSETAITLPLPRQSNNVRNGQICVTTRSTNLHRFASLAHINMANGSFFNLTNIQIITEYEGIRLCPHCQHGGHGLKTCELYRAEVTRCIEENLPISTIVPLCARCRHSDIQRHVCIPIDDVVCCVCQQLAHESTHCPLVKSDYVTTSCANRPWSKVAAGINQSNGQSSSQSAQPNNQPNLIQAQAQPIQLINQPLPPQQPADSVEFQQLKEENRALKDQVTALQRETAEMKAMLQQLLSTQSANNQPTSQSLTHPVNQPVNQPHSLPVNQPIIAMHPQRMQVQQSLNQSAAPTVRQATIPSVNQPSVPAVNHSVNDSSVVVQQTELDRRFAILERQMAELMKIQSNNPGSQSVTPLANRALNTLNNQSVNQSIAAPVVHQPQPIQSGVLPEGQIIGQPPSQPAGNQPAVNHHKVVTQPAGQPTSSQSVDQPAAPAQHVNDQSTPAHLPPQPTQCNTQSPNNQSMNAQTLAQLVTEFLRQLNLLNQPLIHVPPTNPSLYG